ncbi:hypothetical protein [Flavobacterium sp. N2038]|uniref:hypothetical protein n=1 Tax=Flavobacterium sp. N2038 TaxID=2986829 RepID=UPI002224F335|nr:hypothetical protein [Flavobacterium sp. N2038]
MPYLQDIPAEYRTLSRRDHLKRIDHLMSTEGITKILNYSNFSGENESIEHTNSFKQDNHFSFFHKGNIFVIFGKNSEKKIYFENIKKIDVKIQEEIQLSSINKEIFADSLSKLQNDLAHLSFNDIAVEFVDNESIHFALNFDGEKLLMIDKFINPALHGLNENQIFYSFFINRNLISSNVVEISDFVKKFQSYITL